MPQKTVYVELVAQTRKFNEALKRSDQRTSRLITTVKRLGGVLAAAFSARAIFGSFRKTILDADVMIKASKAAGVTAQEFEKLSFIIEKRMGASVGTTSRAFKFLQQRLFNTKRTFDQYFRDAGIDPNLLRNMSPGEQLMHVIRAISMIDNAGKRAAIAGGILGEEVSLEIIKLASDVGAFEDAVGDFERIGSRFGGASADNVENFKDEIANLEQAFEKAKIQIADEALPEITTALEELLAVGAFDAIGKDVKDFVFQLRLLKKDIQEIAGAWDLMWQDIKSVGRAIEKELGLPTDRRDSEGPLTNKAGTSLAPSQPPGVTPLGGFSKSFSPTIIQNFNHVEDRDLPRKAERAAAAAMREAEASQ